MSGIDAERRARLLDFARGARGDDLWPSDVLALLDMVAALGRRLAATERVAYRLAPEPEYIDALVDAELAKEAGG